MGGEDIVHHLSDLIPPSLPRSARDYGTLSCWAHNTVGTQADPCRFTVVEAGPPESVANCTLVNLTVETLEVKCTPGSDGGLPQRFEARVFASPTNTLVTTMVEDAPTFHVGGLTPGQDYVITVTAVNDKGSSKPQEIDAVRLKVAEKRMGDVSAPPVPPLVVVFLGLVGGFVLLLLLGILLTRVRSNRCSCLRHDGRGDTNAGAIVSATETPTNTTTRSSSSAHAAAHTRTAHALREEEEEEAPDVLRTVNETAQLLEGPICPEVIPVRQPPPYSHHKPLMKEGVQLGPGGVGGLYRDPGSPRHLPHDESFV
ncbi:nephrin-like [Penaeus japonicus]|uniref:nephrin-like n=1 Tax=Penaeus japonicus TaxID=27405 RepID=UPI001C70E65B|nr:nephrin-like [Penaeus japonicus]